VATVGSFLYLGALRYRFLSAAKRSAGGASTEGQSLPDGGEELDSTSLPVADAFGAANVIEVDSLEAFHSKFERSPGSAHERQSAPHGVRALFVEEDGVVYTYGTRSTGESAHERSPKSAVGEASSHDE
jgi:hypothetical protein